jgi:hypothetical protein
MSRHDYLIDQLFKTDVDRTLARNFVARYEDNPQVADRVEAFLREGAAVNDRVARGEITGEQGRTYIGEFAGVIGTAEHLIGDGLAWLESGGQSPEDAAAREREVMDELTGPLSPEAKQALAQAERDKGRQEVDRIEKLMQAPEGSPEWKSYWHGENGQRMQAEYRAALERAHGITETPAAAPATPAPAPAAPAAPPGPAAEPAGV